MMSKHVTTTKGMSHFMLFLLRLLALALFYLFRFSGFHFQL